MPNCCRIPVLCLAARAREKFYFLASEEASLALHIVDEGMPPAEYRAMASVPLRQLSLSRGPVEDGYPVLDRAGMEVCVACAR